MNNDGEAGQEQTAKTPNPWTRVGEGHNPYLHNIFVLLGLDPDGSQKEFARVRRNKSQLLGAGKRLTVQGRSLTELDVSRADRLDQRAEEFAAERLLAHTVHEVDLKRFDEARKQVERIQFDPPESLLPLPIRNLSFLTGLVPEPEDLLPGDSEVVPLAEVRDVLRPRAAEEQIFDL